MNANEASALREERAKLFADMQALTDTSGLKTKEDIAKWDAMDVDLRAFTDRITRIERTEKTNEELRATGAPPNGQPQNPGGTRVDPNDEAAQKKAAEEYYRAYFNYLRYGDERRMRGGHLVRGISDHDRDILFRSSKLVRTALDKDDLDLINRELRSLGAAREVRDMGSGGQGAYPGATTGFFVPVGFVDRVTEAMKYYGPMLQVADTFDTATGQPLPFPTDNDTTIMGELIAEGMQVTTQDVTLGQIIFGAYKFSSKLIKVSIELLQDSAFDFETYLTKKFGIRLGRIQNNMYTVGTGVAQPKGIVTASTAGPNAIGSANNDGTTAGGNTIGSDDMTNLEHAVDPLYRPGAIYMFHDTVLSQLKKIKDKYGRPLWVPNVAVKEPDTINGYPYAINNDMDILQTTATSPTIARKTVIFGQVKMYMIRRVKEMSVLRLEERFADYGQVAFLAFYRGDGNLLDAGTHPCAYLVNNF
jgi:HK97 family phage major capsid protein